MSTTIRGSDNLDSANVATDTELASGLDAVTGRAKAWAKWDGASSVVQGGFNVSSITDQGTGLWDMNFTTALTDGNCAGFADSTSSSGSYLGGVNVLASTYLRVCNVYPGLGFNDGGLITGVVFR